MRIVVVLSGLLMVASSVLAEPVLHVAAHSAQLGDVTSLGGVDVEGVGEVQLSAKRSGSQILVKAIGPGEVMLGRAETTIGLSETPVYISTPSGLRKITIYWGRSEE